MKKEIKKNLRKIINKIANSPLGGFSYYLLDIFVMTEYHIIDFFRFLSGKKKPSSDGQQNIKNNVTFIYKSFERQKCAKRLFYNIQKYYPGVKVIVADDSKEPLIINHESIEVIQLPFNSGLSIGLISALKKVKTPFVIRMDDDELLSRFTNFEKHWDFLMKHHEVDLVAVLPFTAPIWLGAANQAKKYYAKKMEHAPLPQKIPHMTQIDSDHVVVAKPPNVFIARTEKIREVGYDEKIRMADHYDFFHRASGKLTSVLNKKTWIFHYHNPFDAHYNHYRSNISGDIAYLRKKYNIKY